MHGDDLGFLAAGWPLNKNRCQKGSCSCSSPSLNGSVGFEFRCYVGFASTCQRTEMLAEIAAIRVVLIKVRGARSEEHTSELQSRGHLVCRLLHEKKKWIGKAPLLYYCIAGDHVLSVASCSIVWISLV